MIMPVYHRGSVAATIPLLILSAACSDVTIDGRASAVGAEPGVAAPATGALFGPPQPWTKDVAGLPPSERSDAIITALTSLGGWGNGNRLQLDLSMPLLFADGATPRRTVTAPADGYCYDGPDCDPVPLDVPIPADGNAEGSADYTCNTGTDDCHVLVVETAEQRLYELYNATKDGPAHTARGAFVWDLKKSYPDGMRGDQCTSADAAGFPIAGLLPTADEVAAGRVAHALRFILPNDRMKSGVFVHPAGHAGGPASDNPDAPPYGVRFRLKASFDEGPFNASERVILGALKTHGMLPVRRRRDRADVRRRPALHREVGNARHQRPVVRRHRSGAVRGRRPRPRDPGHLRVRAHALSCRHRSAWSSTACSTGGTRSSSTAPTSNRANRSLLPLRAPRNRRR